MGDLGQIVSKVLSTDSYSAIPGIFTIPVSKEELATPVPAQHTHTQMHIYISCSLTSSK